jgi:hypothetical protein
MNNLITNRIRFELIIPKEGIKIYCTKSESLFRLKYQYFVEKFKNNSDLSEFIKWFGNYDNVDIKEQPFVYYDFQEINSEDNFQFTLDEILFNKIFKKQFIKQSLINHFKSKRVLIEPYITGKNLSVYIFTSEFDHEWDKYSQYAFVIKEYRNEIIFNKTSENVLISKNEISDDSFPNIEFNKLRAIDPTDQFIKKVKYIDYRPLKVIANNDVKKEISVSPSPKRVSYALLYNYIKRFYSGYLLELKTKILKIQSGGFVHVHDKDLGRVYQGSNVMVFKNEKTDINAATGMRDYGNFQPSPVAKEVQFIFIYENYDDANKLYQYLKNGLRHFPGLQTYVEIPPTLADLRLKYEKQSLKKTFDNFLSEKLPNNNYEKYFVILIGPFKKNNQSDDLNNLYYYIKKELLKKGITSQFIYYQNIRSDQFHFFLPNIAIAMLAKLGGIPWKLKEQPYKELIIGFNAKEIDNTKYIGSAVFFDNQGHLKNVNSYKGRNLRNIANGLKQAIEDFREMNPEENLKRVIIHTYKPFGKKEQRIEKLLREELDLDIPLIYIEINETKSNIEVCFDENYKYGMPVSGTYIKTGRNEYLLFNNTRYHEKPLRSVKEEWPIKLRIYSGENINLDEKQLISQIYEFSRLYWKGLKQKSQPVTTIYSKLIAEYTGYFVEQIPRNKISQETPWFL